MSINRKLTIVFSVMVVLTILVSGNFIMQLQRLDKVYTNSIDTLTPALLSTADISIVLTRIAYQVQAYTAGQEEGRDIYEVGMQEIDAFMDSMNEQAASADTVSANTIASLESAFQTFKDEMASIVALVDEGKPEEAREVLFSTGIKAAMALDTEGLAIQDAFAERLAIANTENTKTATTTTIVGIVLVVIIILATIALLSYLRKTITAPINQLNDAVQKVSAGDLSSPNIDIRTKDEIENLATAFNTMKESLRDVIGSIKSGVENVQQTATTMDESLQQTNESSTVIQENIQDVLSLAKNNVAIANDAALAMDETASGVQRIAEVTQSLQEVAVESVQLSSTGQSAILY